MKMMALVLAAVSTIGSLTAVAGKQQGRGSGDLLRGKEIRGSVGDQVFGETYINTGDRALKITVEFESKQGGVVRTTQANDDPGQVFGSGTVTVTSILQRGRALNAKSKSGEAAFHVISVFEQ